MKFNIFDEKNVIVIECNFVVGRAINPYAIISYNMKYNKYFHDKATMDLYIKNTRLNIIDYYELFYYNDLAFADDLQGYDLASVGMKYIIELAYKKTGSKIVVKDLKPGNRYVLADATEILYLGYADERYHYLPFTEYLDRMEKGKKVFEIDNPERLKRRLTVNYQRMPMVIGDLGPYWNNNCFKIIKGKVHGV